MKIVSLLALLSLPPVVAAQTITLVSPQLKDSAGVPVADGVATITPTLCNGVPTPYKVLGGGARTQASVAAAIVAGALAVTLPDTGQTSPHICFAMTVKDRLTGATLIGKGYDKMQPAATASWCATVAGVTTCNLDNYDPNLVPVVPVGPNGPSAYQLAVASGFSGTQAQWLQSLQGPPGTAGTLGPAGLSAYQLALSNGFVGTQAQWLASLQGSGGFGPVTDGMLNASQYPTGAGRDAVENAETAPNQVVNVGDIGPHITVIPKYSGSAIHDFTPGYEGHRYFNCLNQSKMHDVAAADGSACSWDHATFDGETNMGYGQQMLHQRTLWAYGASANYSSDWRVVSVDAVRATVANRGIANGYGLVYRHNAIGDANIWNTYAYFDGGFKTGSDEGHTGIRGSFIQNCTYWHGTSLSAGTGLTIPLLSDSTATPLCGEDNNHTTDGGYLLDIGKGTVAGTVTGPAVPVPGSAYLYQLPTAGAALPSVVAWGTCAAAIAESKPSQTNQPVTCVATVNAGTFTAGGLVLVASAGAAEQAPITAVSTLSGGVQTITLATRHRHPAGATVFQGPAAAYLSFDNNVASTGMRTAYPTFGSLDGVHLIYAFYPQGTYHADYPNCGAQAFCAGVAGRNGFHLYPGAEVVANLSLHHDPQLEPNSVVFAVGDPLEAPLPDEVYMTGLKLLCSLSTPPNGSPSPCDSVVVGGPGWVSDAVARLTLNTNNPAIYKQFGGTYDPSPMHWIRGYFGFANLYDLMPDTLTKIYSMTQPDHHGRLFGMPSGDIWWYDDVRRLYTPHLGSDDYTGPASAPTGPCTTAQAGAWAFSQDGLASFCNATVSATGTWTVKAGAPTTVTIASIVVALPTTAIDAGACVAGTAAMPGAVAGNSTTPGTVFSHSFLGDPTAVTGYGPTATLTFWDWPTANTYNWKECNAGAAPVTPGAMNLSVGGK